MEQLTEFRREHHRLIGAVLSSLDGELLRNHNCYFGGGTAIALAFNEFRTSRDVDFLIQDKKQFLNLKNLIKETSSNTLFRPAHSLDLKMNFIESTNYAIRHVVVINQVDIKFEIIHEANLKARFDTPIDQINGISVLSKDDLIATKLLANVDRYADRGTFNRDVIDLSFMNIGKISETKGYLNAIEAYGPSITISLNKAIDHLVGDINWLQRCIDSLEIEVAPARLISNLRKLYLDGYS